MKGFTVTNLFIDLPVASVVLLLSLAFLFYMHKMYQRQLKDRQQELNRLAEENRQYREMFTPFVHAGLKKLSKISHNREAK